MSEKKEPEPEKSLKELEKQQELEDAAFLANLEKDSKEFDKVCSQQLLKGLLVRPGCCYLSMSSSKTVY